MIWIFVKERFHRQGTDSVKWLERYGFSSLRLPDIRLLCWIGFAEAFIWGVIITLLPVMGSRAGIPPGKIGWLFSAYFVVYILLQHPVGRWSDRQGRKKPILLGLSIYTLAVLLLSQEGGLFYMMASPGRRRGRAGDLFPLDSGRHRRSDGGESPRRQPGVLFYHPDDRVLFGSEHQRSSGRPLRAGISLFGGGGRAWRRSLGGLPSFGQALAENGRPSSSFQRMRGERGMGHSRQQPFLSL